MKAMKMIKLGLAILIFLLVALPSVALAQEEPPKYNFATAQGKSSLQAIPGKKEARGVIYFYNVDGNRITHITLEVTEAPDNWEVEFDPPLHQQEVSFGGTTITVTENLYAEPTQVSAEEIKDVPEGMICLTLPNKLEERLFSTDSVEVRDDLNNGVISEEFRSMFKDEGFSLPEGATVTKIEGGDRWLVAEDGTVTKTTGGNGWSLATEERFNVREEDGGLNIYRLKPGYALAQVATIIVRVPKSEPIGTTSSIKILGTASWLGQTGQGEIKGPRDFDFSVQTVYEITDEEIVHGGKGFDVGRWLPVIIAVAIVTLAAVLLPRFLRRRRAG